MKLMRAMAAGRGRHISSQMTLKARAQARNKLDTDDEEN